MTHTIETLAPADYLSANGFSMTSTFCAPQRGDDEWKSNAVNHIVIVKYKDAVIYTGPYTYGVGNLPGYSHTTTRDQQIKISNAVAVGQWHYVKKGKRQLRVPAPKLADVMCSLLTDASVIEDGTFEDWCDSLGYDTDSRKAELIHDNCVAVALKFNAYIPRAIRDELLEMFQDY